LKRTNSERKGQNMGMLCNARNLLAPKALQDEGEQ
jgi:hypothetical protein